ncbi:MAG: ATP-dependent helicase HrpB [Sneathiella sp.]|nr:MAG: ATP-dependent helicase HrpB [Sneathiella sp.]
MTIHLPNTGLPVEAILPEIKEALRNSDAVILQAAPGAGKTTLVPLYLLRELLAEGQKIIMLEPRRLAARASARRMADLIGEKVGETVGFRVRLESKVSAATRIEVVTEGILTRRLQSDPELKGVGIVIFDEFHERSLQTDLGLALTRQVQDVLRDDLKIVVMSATIDAVRLANMLGNAAVVETAGRQFPVETKFLPRPIKSRIEPIAATAVETAIKNDAGDILVFLPGAGEINRTQALLTSVPNVVVVPLYGNLSQKEQDKAIQSDPDGRRKVILSTDIAETSLTIEGVQVVIDAGLARAPRFDPNSGMSRLETARVSRASADQRRGRAGRLGPGTCYRLWTAAEDRALVDYREPEIASVDLTGLVLELANWGVQDVSELLWLTPPPRGPVAQAKELLVTLGALDGDGRMTPLGKEMVRLPLSPRLARMVIEGQKRRQGQLACDLAALLSERDILSRNYDAPNSDICARLEILAMSNARKGSAAQVLRSRDDLLRRLGVKAGKTDIAMAGLLLAFAYPDRIAERRDDRRGQYRLSGGRGARLVDNDKLLGEPYLVVADLDGKGREARIYLAAALSFADIDENFATVITTQRRVFWDEKKRRVVAISERKLGALVLQSKRLENPSSDEISAALLTVVRTKGLDILPWETEATTLVERVNFARHHERTEDWPDMSKSLLLETLEDWLRPYLAGLSSLDDLKTLKLADILASQLTWEQQNRLKKIAPGAITVPSGSNIRLDYSDPETPVLAARLQELFGMESVPLVGGGKVAVAVHLLSPARRPVQITKDLASFWRTTYTDVKKDLKGRYPKHYWPDDPLQAEATSRIKPRKS